MESFGKLSALILVLFGALFLKAFVFMKLFSWFIVPLMDVQPLTLGESCGIIVIGLLFAQPKKRDGDLSDMIGKLIGEIFILNALTLFLGWIIFKLFV